jgi:hypothetical protein
MRIVSAKSDRYPLICLVPTLLDGELVEVIVAVEVSFTFSPQ